MNEMLQVLVKRVGNLFSVKSIVTISLTIAFVILSLRGVIEGKDFLTIFFSYIAFYFGSQKQRRSKTMLQINTSLRASRIGGKRPLSAIKAIVFHYTANTGTHASALGNARYFANGSEGRAASAHYCVDERTSSMNAFHWIQLLGVLAMVRAANTAECITTTIPYPSKWSATQTLPGDITFRKKRCVTRHGSIRCC